MRQRYGKQLQRLQTKQETLAAARDAHAQAAAGLQAAAAAHEEELRATEEQQEARRGWVGSAESAIADADAEAARHGAWADAIARVASAEEAVRSHRAQERSQLHDLEEEAASIRAAQRTHADSVVQMEAEAELLSRQLGTLQDQRVRLERDKRLAASSQKFAEAGKVAAELKSLAARFEADKEAQERLLGQAEAARSAQADGAGGAGEEVRRTCPERSPNLPIGARRAARGGAARRAAHRAARAGRDALPARGRREGGGAGRVGGA